MEDRLTGFAVGMSVAVFWEDFPMSTYSEFEIVMASVCLPDHLCCFPIPTISICEIRAKDTRATRIATQTQQRSQYLWLLLLLFVVVDGCFCCLFILLYEFYP